jgi:transposase-like protein
MAGLLAARPPSRRLATPKNAAQPKPRGATIAEIADALGVKTRCLYNWLNLYPVIPRWRNGRQVSRATRFCSDRCPRKAKVAARNMLMLRYASIRNWTCYQGEEERSLAGRRLVLVTHSLVARAHIPTQPTAYDGNQNAIAFAHQNYVLQNWNGN